MTRKTFADFRPRQGGIPHGCRVCGVETVGTVSVSMRARQAKGVNGPGRQIASLQMSFCEQHAVEVFENVVAQFPEKR